MSPNQPHARKRWPNGPLTLALAHYDRHVPLIEGDASIPGVELKVLVVGQSDEGRDGNHRHERMLNEEEFDVAEVSLSSYLMAKDQGAPFTAIPVFPRRLFSMSQMWIRKDSGIHSPADLIGKTVGLNTFQTTLSVLAKADLGRMYEVPWREIHWVVVRDETRPFVPDPNVKLSKLSAGDSLVDCLLSGRLDSVIVPHPPRAFLESPQVARLLEDPMVEETNYFERFGSFPIMHVVAFRNEVLKKSPELAVAMFNAFQQSWEIARERWDDPNWSYLAWGRHSFEQQHQLLASDIWPNGLQKNLDNLTWFIEQSHDQGLITRTCDPSEMFYPTTHGT